MKVKREFEFASRPRRRAAALRGHRWLRGARGLLAAALLAAVALLPSACASGRVRPGTGDISFRLTWTGTADLDLYVLSPLGERVDFIRRRAASGGALDVDCNVHGTQPCAVPMENIFWPKRAAPPGKYLFWAAVANHQGLLPEDTYRLEVRFGRLVVHAHDGPVSELDDEPAVAAILLPGEGR